MPSLYTSIVIIISSEWQQGMINPNMYVQNDRSNKLVAQSSPQVRKKNQYGSGAQLQGGPNAGEFRKETTMAQLSPQHYYPQQKTQQSKPIQVTSQKEASLENAMRELGERVAKIAQKLGQHESILIRMTENSIESNKEEYKKGGKGESGRHLDALNDTISKLRREFEDYRAGNIMTREMEVKQQLYSQLIHKSEERMREEMQSMIKKTMEFSETKEAPVERMQEIERTLRKMQKNVSMNTNKIFGAYQKIQSISSSLDGHMDLINTQLNKAINKIVSFVNQKVSKPLSESIAQLKEKLDNSLTDTSRSSFANLRISSKRSDKPTTAAQYKQTLTAYSQEIIISEKMYYIDIDGYLLDQDFYYLLDRNEERIRLDEAQLKTLRQTRLIH